MAKPHKDVGIFAMLTAVIVSTLRIVYNVVKSGENLSSQLEQKTALYALEVNESNDEKKQAVLEATNAKLVAEGKPAITMEDMEAKMQAIASRK